MKNKSNAALALNPTPNTPLDATFDDAFVYRGMCDASAAAALGEDLFVVANDENNRLLVYRRGQAVAVAQVDLSAFLDTARDEESDLEGAATIGQRIYWISSHGRNKNGKVRKSRYRFFATEASGKDARVQPVGIAYAGLLDDMIATGHLDKYALKNASSQTPEAQGALNIEGLAATLFGGLLIGMRNPAPEGMALIVPLLNPAEVVDGKAAPRFGDAIELDLGGLAIRSIELVGLAYFIVAGPPGDKGKFALYQWSGDAQDAPLRLQHAAFDTLRPEALFAIPGTRKIALLSDDGGPHVKELDETEQTFRSVTLTL